MALALFSVTHTTVHDQYFPSLAAFSGSTRPTSTAVGAMVDEAAGVLGARLLSLGSNPVTISVDAGATYPNAYQWCKRFVGLHTAVAAFRAMSGGGKVPEEWTSDLERMLDALDEMGLLALGDAPTPAQDTRGPFDHIKTHGIDVGTSVSDLVPDFTMDDEL
jgi:hypothetical protein